MNALKALDIILDLWGAPLIAHLGILRSMPAHVLNFCILFNCICIAFILLLWPSHLRKLHHVS
jgi:hypothetical protein